MEQRNEINSGVSKILIILPNLCHSLKTFHIFYISSMPMFFWNCIVHPPTSLPKRRILRFLKANSNINFHIEPSLNCFKKMYFLSQHSMYFLWPRFNGTDKILLLFTIAVCILIPSQNATHGKNLHMESTQWMFFELKTLLYSAQFSLLFQFFRTSLFLKKILNICVICEYKFLKIKYDNAI